MMSYRYGGVVMRCCSFTGGGGGGNIMDTSSHAICTCGGHRVVLHTSLSVRFRHWLLLVFLFVSTVDVTLLHAYEPYAPIMSAESAAVTLTSSTSVFYPKAPRFPAVRISVAILTAPRPNGKDYLPRTIKAWAASEPKAVYLAATEALPPTEPQVVRMRPPPARSPQRHRGHR